MDLPSTDAQASLTWPNCHEIGHGWWAPTATWGVESGHGVSLVWVVNNQPDGAGEEMGGRDAAEVLWQHAIRSHKNCLQIVVPTLPLSPLPCCRVHREGIHCQ